MIALYTLIVVLLGVVSFLVAWRAKALEKKFSRVSLAAAKLSTLPLKSGTGRGDVCQSAKQQFELGRLVHLRDRLEGKYFRWQKLAEKVTRMVKSVRQWKGRKLPYTFGVIDVSALLYLVDRLGLAFIDLSQLAEMASSLLNR
jgi:hypothetical protein